MLGSMANERDDWRISTEGDLDPDLTDEAGYSGWEPRRRTPWAMLYRLALLAVLIGMVGSALMVFMR
jgi:hypothetical protein